jgi:hypothetical protein
MSGPLHPYDPDSPDYQAMRDAGREPRRMTLICDRCLRDTTVLIPYARGEDTRFGYRCCMSCYDEMVAAKR